MYQKAILETDVKLELQCIYTLYRHMVCATAKKPSIRLWHDQRGTELHTAKASKTSTHLLSVVSVHLHQLADIKPRGTQDLDLPHIYTLKGVDAAALLLNVLACTAALLRQTTGAAAMVPAENLCRTTMWAQPLSPSQGCGTIRSAQQNASPDLHADDNGNYKAVTRQEQNKEGCWPALQMAQKK